MDTNSAEEKITALCEELKIPSPIEFLTKIMGGTDPRRVSLVYSKIIELESKYGLEPPDEWDWIDLIELIKMEYRGSIVDMGKSQDAAKQLLEYTHPKRKAIEMVSIDKTPKDKKLTRMDIKRLNREFDLEY